jgi:hypothetical protein
VLSRMAEDAAESFALARPATGVDICRSLEAVD